MRTLSINFYLYVLVYKTSGIILTKYFSQMKIIENTLTTIACIENSAKPFLETKTLLQ